MRECVIPEPAQRDKDSVEMIRVWIAEEGLHCTINIGVYENHSAPEQVAWGIILSDVARHVANALHQRYGADVATSIGQIRDSLLKELSAPTSDAKGGFAPSCH